MTQINKNGEIKKVFTGTGSSDQGYTSKGKTVIVDGDDNFQIDAEVSKDGGTTWTIIKSFTAATVENFEWKGLHSIIRFTCSTFDTNPVTVIFE